jgi:cyclophilin family peptidyl-prolyl cis-trans isomerase
MTNEKDNAMKKWTFSLLIMVLTLSVQAQTNVVFYTNMGNFMIEIREDLVPITGNNFLDLVNDKYYDGIIFHRVIDDFMIQGGDPTGTGSGGPGYTIEDEFHPDLDNAQMTISMANAGPDTGGSQFFINLTDNFYLDYDVAPLEYAHPVFGIVTEGFEVVQDIGGVATNASDRPIADVVMDSIRVTDDYVPLGIASSEPNKNAVSIYPNPLTDLSIIRIDAEKQGTSQIEVYDAFGKLISSVNLELLQGENKITAAQMLTENCAAGIYHLRVTIDDETEVVRFCVQ